MTYKDKLQQANKEAKSAVVALFLTVLVWIISGFGVAQFNITIFNTPLWIITGCFGTWIFAIIAAVIMSKYVFKDIELDDDSDFSGLTNEALNPVKPSTSLQGSVEVSDSSHVEREERAN